MMASPCSEGKGRFTHLQPLVETRHASQSIQSSEEGVVDNGKKNTQKNDIFSGLRT